MPDVYQVVFCRLIAKYIYNIIFDLLGIGIETTAEVKYVSKGSWSHTASNKWSAIYVYTVIDLVFFCRSQLMRTRLLFFLDVCLVSQTTSSFTCCFSRSFFHMFFDIVAFVRWRVMFQSWLIQSSVSILRCVWSSELKFWRMSTTWSSTGVIGLRLDSQL